MQDINNNVNTGIYNVELPSEPKLSFFQKIGGVVYSPGVAMKSIAAWPDVLWPILLVSIFPLIFTLPIIPIWLEYFKKVLDIQMKNSGTAIPPDMMALTLNISLISTIVGVIIGGLLLWVITAAVSMGLVKLFGGIGNFKQYLAVVGYAAVISLILQLIGIPMAYVTNKPIFDISLSYFTTALLTGMEKTFQFGFIYSILSAISLFKIWYFVVLAIGISAVSKVDMKKIAWLMFGVYIALTILGAVYSGVTESMSGSVSATIF